MGSRKVYSVYHRFDGFAPRWTCPAPSPGGGAAAAGRIGPAAAERILPGGSVLAGPGAVGVARPPVPSRSGAGGLARFEAASAERVRIAGSGVSIVCMSGRTVEN